MYRKEVRERSPMRLFDHASHPGLKPGDIGVVVAKPGVGKSALLVQLALDVLLSGRRVLHVSHDHPVDRVRAQYDELLHDLIVAHDIDQPQAVRVEAERNRLLYSHLSAEQAPLSARGGLSSLAKIEQTLTFTQQTAHFDPDVVIIDGFDFDQASAEAIAQLAKVAARVECAMWLSARSTAESLGAPSERGDGRLELPADIARFADHLAVIIGLRPTGPSTELHLCKDREETAPTAPVLHLDPCTMRVTSEAPVTEPPPRLQNPREYHLYSGGAKGAEAAFGACAERWGLRETHYSFEGHPFRERENGIELLEEDELKRGDASIAYASNRLGRPLTQIPNIQRILQTVWHQITAANEVFVIGAIEEDGTVKGGTGWGAELARLWNKPLFVFDQERQTWHAWDSTQWRQERDPVIRRRAFAGIGTLRLTPAGRKAIEDLFERSFGPHIN